MQNYKKELCEQKSQARQLYTARNDTRRLLKRSVMKQYSVQKKNFYKRHLALVMMMIFTISLMAKRNTM